MINNILLENTKTVKAMDKYGLYWYKFNEMSGNATDSKGNNYTGILTNATRVDGWDGEGNAIDFNGNSLVTFNNSLMTYGEKTIVLRFKTSSNKNMYLFENYATSSVNQTGYNMIMNQGKIIMRRFISTGAEAVFAFTLASTKAYNDNQWHKVMFSWTGNTSQDAKLYVDDELVDSQKSTANETSTNFATQNMVLGGCKLTTYRRYFTGQIDDLQIYNKTLSSSDFTIDKTFILHDGEYKKLGKVYSQNPTNLIENLKFDGSSEIKGVKGTVFTSPNLPNQIHDSEHGYVSSFNGINQHLRSTVNNLFPIGDKIIKYKIKVSSKKTQIIMSTSENTKRGWFIGVSDVGTLHYAVNITGASTWDISSQNGKTMICDNKWHELILEYKDGQYIKWYVDGVLDYYLAHSYKESTTATNNLVIGCRAFDSGTSTLSPYYFEGQFTDLEIYKGELKELVQWFTVSSTLPTSTQFLEQGMENLSDIDRKVIELEPTTMTNKVEILDVIDIGKVFSKTINLKKYFDIRSIRTEVK